MTDPLSCEQCEEWLPGYVLNDLDAEEAAAVAEHLHTCARCQASLAAYEVVMDNLAEAVPQQEPPADLQSRLLAAVTAGLTPTMLVQSPSSLRWWQGWTPRWVPVLAVVNALLFLGAAWWAWQGWQEVAHVRAQWQQTTQQLEGQRQALALLTRPDSRPVPLRSASTQARGTLLLHASTPDAVLVVQDLPPLKPGRVYQLWLRRGESRDNGGVFRVDEQGFGVVLIHAPYPLAAYQRAGITEEPAGGSPGPTSPGVIGGPLTAPPSP
ncbi:MAG TPA: anti-sigma factor [Candidatus Tectomicrobia bacterium]|jgi:hypothetical protein